MKKILLCVMSISLVIPFCSLRAGVYFGFEIKPMVFKGEASPGSGETLPMNIMYSLGGGTVINNIHFGLAFHSFHMQNAFRINFDDQTSEVFDAKVQGVGFSAGYVREPFFVSLLVSPASFTILSPTTLPVSPHYEVSSQSEWGLVIPLTAGLKWRIFYVGGFANYIDWYSTTEFSKYESPLPYHWYLVDSKRRDCTIHGFGIGLSLGMRISI